LLGLFDAVRAEARADEQRALLDDLEIDLGRGEARTASSHPFSAGRLVAGARIAGHGRTPCISTAGSTSTSNTCTTGPPRRIVSPSSTTRAPPGTCTVTRSPTRPRRWATAATAHAPVPHDNVSPTPRSHTRIRIPPLPS